MSIKFLRFSRGFHKIHVTFLICFPHKAILVVITSCTSVLFWRTSFSYTYASKFMTVFHSSDRHRRLCQNWNNRNCCQNTCDDCHRNDDFFFHRCSFPHFPPLIHALCNRSETHLPSLYARQCQKLFIWLNLFSTHFQIKSLAWVSP